MQRRKPRVFSDIAVGNGLGRGVLGFRNGEWAFSEPLLETVSPHLSNTRCVCSSQVVIGKRGGDDRQRAGGWLSGTDDPQSINDPVGVKSDVMPKALVKCPV